MQPKTQHRMFISGLLPVLHGFVSKSLIYPGLHAVNIIMSLVTLDSYSDPADTKLLR